MSLGADTVFFLSFVGDCARIAGFSMKWLSRDIMTIPTDQLAKKSPRHSSSTDYYSKVGMATGILRADTPGIGVAIGDGCAVHSIFK